MDGAEPVQLRGGLTLETSVPRASRVRLLRSYATAPCQEAELEAIETGDNRMTPPDDGHRGRHRWGRKRRTSQFLGHHRLGAADREGIVLHEETLERPSDRLRVRSRGSHIGETRLAGAAQVGDQRGHGFPGRADLERPGELCLKR